MKRYASVCFVFLFCLGVSAGGYYEYKSGDDLTANAGFYLGINGNYSNPVRLSADNYSAAPGLGGRIGLNMNGLRGFVGWSMFLAFDKNAMELKNSSVQADVYDAYLGFEAILFSVKYGVGIGGLSLSLPDHKFDELGGTTLTELAHENGRVQMCQSVWTGLRVPIPVENDFWNRWSMDYEYRMISADRAWMFWHDLVSSLIVGVGYDIGQNISEALLKKDMEVASVIVSFATIGMAAMYWYYDYEYHNWPWNDEPPFRMHRHSICLNFQFKRFKIE